MALFASVLGDSPHLKALVESAEAVLDGIDLTPLLVYFIDTTSVEALPYLAEQFNVLGYKGWSLAVTEEQQRELLKKALSLQKYKGTPWSIKEALKTAGFAGAEIQEGGTGYFPKYDAEYTHNGLLTYGGQDLYEWATFTIVFDLGETRGITDAETDLAIEVVKAYKNARSRLVGFSFKVSMSDTIAINDDALSYLWPLQDESDSIGLVHNGQAQYDGLFTYSGAIGDSASLQIKNTSGTIIYQDTF